MALEFPSDLKTRGSGFVKFITNNENGEYQGETTVLLPLPSNLVFGDTAQYNNADIGAAGALIASGMSAKEAADAVAGAAQRYAAKFDDLDVMAKDIGAKLLEKMGNKSTQLRQRSVPNPNTRALFESVSLRNFSFNFEMVAMDPSDRVLIENIIKFFRANMLPADEDPEVPLFYKMPNTFKISCYLQGPKQDEVPIEAFGIKDCYLQTCGVTFDTNTVLAEEGYNPWFAKTDVALSFMEHKTLSIKDVLEPSSD